MVGSYGFGIDNVNGLTFDPNTNTLFGSGNFFNSDELLIIRYDDRCSYTGWAAGFEGVQGLALAPSGVPNHPASRSCLASQYLVSRDVTEDQSPRLTAIEWAR